MEPNDELAMLRQAESQRYENFQRLTFILERKGIITAEELAEVYGETPDPK
jgi:hypothetical protein